MNFDLTPRGQNGGETALVSPFYTLPMRMRRERGGAGNGDTAIYRSWNVNYFICGQILCTQSAIIVRT